MALTTVDFVCGAECGIAAAGTVSGGTEHWSSTAEASVVTSGPTPMRSTRAIRLNSSAGAAVTHTFATAIASPATLVGRCYVYFATLPNTDIAICRGSQGFGVIFKQSDSKLYAGVSGGAIAAAGLSVTTGQWYRIDWTTVMNTTRTADFQLDGVAATQYSVAGAAATETSVVFGTSVTNWTGDVYIDDIIIGHTSGNYPIGEGTVVGLYPNGDRTNSAANPTDGNNGHFYSATTDFGKGSGGGTNLGAQDAESTSWQSLQNPLSTSIPTNFIANKTGSGTEHLCWTMPLLPNASPLADGTYHNGVLLVCTSHSASATTNDFGTALIGSSDVGFGALGATLSPGDLSETTITVPVVAGSIGTGRGPYFLGIGGTLLFYWGHSTDVNPDVYLDGIMAEVDYVPAPGGRNVYVLPAQAAQRASRW